MEVSWLSEVSCTKVATCTWEGKLTFGLLHETVKMAMYVASPDIHARTFRKFRLREQIHLYRCH